MAELKKHALLLSLLCALVLVKFIIVPLFDWQESIIFENNSMTKRLDKVDQVLVNEKNVQQNNQKLTLALAKAKAVFFPVQTESAFKLTQQQVLEQLLSKYKLQSSNIGWQTETQLQQSNVTRFQVQLSISGKFIDLVLFLSELESQSPWYQIDDFNISTKATESDMPGYIKNARVRLNLFTHKKSGE